MGEAYVEQGTSCGWNYGDDELDWKNHQWNEPTDDGWNTITED